MKLLSSSLSSTLHASCIPITYRYNDIQLTNTIFRSGQVQTRPYYENPVQQPRRPFSCRRDLSTATVSRVNDTSAGKAKEPVAYNTEKDASSLSHQVRLLMRRVPHPVAIITASDKHPSRADQVKFRGMTVSSFNTVTLFPEPVVSFNVRQPSETLSALQSSGRFLVHLLGSSIATAQLARDFSQGNNNLQLSRGLGDFEFDILSPSSPSPSPSPSSSAGNLVPLPILRRKHTALKPEAETEFPFILECTYLPQHAIQIHDHTVVLGSVVRVLEQPHQASGTDDGKGSTDCSNPKDNNDFCLTYADTGFWKIGGRV